MLFLNLYTVATATVPSASALTTAEVADHLGLTDGECAALQVDCARHGRYWIDADTYVMVWNRGL